MVSKTFEENKKIALLNKYTDVYNNLDNLCWSISTRVFAANLASSIAVAFRSNSDGHSQMQFAFVTVFFVLAIVNFLGAKSLWKLWNDQVQMGYAIKRLDDPIGYFRTRHQDPETFKSWSDLRGKFGLVGPLTKSLVWSSARGLNVNALLILAYAFAAIAITGVIGIFIADDHFYIFEAVGNFAKKNYWLIIIIVAGISTILILDRISNNVGR